jgi:hypothetical protein
MVVQKQIALFLNISWNLKYKNPSAFGEEKKTDDSVPLVTFVINLLELNFWHDQKI